MVLRVDDVVIKQLAEAWLQETKRLRAQVACDCGCGEVISGRVRFRPGHDAKLLASYEKRIREVMLQA